MTGHHWFADVAEAAVGRSCSFFHAAALRRGGSLREHLTGALEERGLVPRFVEGQSVAERGGWDDVLPLVEDVGAGDIVVIWGPERLGARRDFANLLAQSRPKAQALLATGARVLIVSSRPRAWFPDPDGSSLISDASKVHPTAVTAETVRHAQPIIEAEAAERIAGHAVGSVSLAQCFAAIELAEGSSRAKRASAEKSLRDAYRDALAELCIEDLAVLERELLDLGRYDVPEDDFPASLASQLVDAGLASVNDTTGVVSLIESAHRGLAREALVFVLQRVVVPPAQWRKLAGELFTYERFVRLTLACHFEHTIGDSWKSDALVDLGSKALGIARGEGFVAGDAVSDLATPLDWLLLDDLFTLASVAADGGHVGGLSARDWMRQAAVLVVRRRIDLAEGFASALDFGDDVLRGGFPDEWFGVGVPVFGPGGDGRGEFVDAGEGAAA